MHLRSRYPAYHYIRKTPLTTTEAEKNLDIYVTMLPVEVKSVPIIVDRQKSNKKKKNRMIEYTY